MADASEAARLQALAGYQVLDTPTEEAFDRLTALAADLFDAPIALVSLVDAERQWFKSRHGLESPSTPRSWAFCDHAIRMGAHATLIVEDASVDPRFKNNPLVVQDPKVRFYTGTVLTDRDGFNLGSLCIIDTQARPTPSPKDLRRLQLLARMVVDELELRRATRLAQERGDLLAMAERLSGVGSWRYEIESQAVTWSDETYRIHGVAPDGFTPDIATALSFYQNENERSRIAALIETAIRTGEGFEQEFWIRRPDGTLRSVIPKAACLFGERGEVTALHGVFHDVTAQRAVLRDLQQQQKTTAGALAVAEEQTRRAALAEAVAGLGHWRLDSHTGEITWSDQMYAIYALPPGSPLDLPMVLGMTHAEDRATQSARIEAQFEARSGEPNAITRIIAADGELRFLASNSVVEWDESGAPMAIIGTVMDVTPQKTVELALTAERELLQVTLNAIADGVVSTNENGDIRDINPAAERMLGISSSDVRGLPFQKVVQLFNQQTGLSIKDPMDRAVTQAQVAGMTHEAILCVESYSGGRPIQYSVSVIRGRQAQYLGAVMVLQDQSEIRLLAQRMSHLAQHDPLTNLPNRILLHDRVRQAVESGQRNKRAFGIAYLDLDGFKAVNDSLGHLAGDELLKIVGARLKNALRASDTICRLGGDEFAVLLTDLESPQAAADIAQELVRKVAQPCRLGDADVIVSTSLGLALYPRDGEDADALMRNADCAMYRAKTMGKNRFQLFSALPSKTEVDAAA